jgi:hypothetical protein
MRKHGNTDEAIPQEELQEAIEVLREKGFDQNRFEFLRNEYAKMPRRKPRKKMKIKVDEFGCPKVTKTPLEPQLSARFAYIKLTKSG